MSEKYLKIISAFIIASVLLSSISHAATPEQIESFDVDIIINKDSSIDVTERIVYDFGTNQKHGIIREIPVQYTDDSEARYAEIQLKSVNVINNKSNVDEVDYISKSRGGYANIQIGDADKLVSGKVTYLIKYNYKGAFLYFDSYDELFWNVTGNGWDVPINSVKATILLSDDFSLSSEFNPIKQICYTGILSSKQSECTIEDNQSEITVITKNPLKPHEGLTLSVGYPPDVLKKYNMRSESVNYDASFKSTYNPDSINVSTIIFIIVVINLLTVLIIIFLWYFWGRDPRDNKIVIPMYDPPRHVSGRYMTPAEVGAIVREKIDNDDITAEIIDLVVKKYLVINQLDKEIEDSNIKDLEFSRGSQFSEDPELLKLPHHQKEIYKILKMHISPKKKLSDFINNFGSDIDRVKQVIMKDLTESKYFKNNPRTIRTIFITFGTVSLVLMMPLISVLLFYLSYIMPKRTMLGVEAKRLALGLKMFLKTQERQMEFQEHNMYFFEKLLPYAIGFNLADVWESKLQDLFKISTQSDQIDINGIRTFQSGMSINSISLITKSIGTAYSFSAVSYSGSSGTRSGGFRGGGFSHSSHSSSGGGFGGGGGRSW